MNAPPLVYSRQSSGSSEDSDPCETPVNSSVLLAPIPISKDFADPELLSELITGKLAAHLVDDIVRSQDAAESLALTGRKSSILSVDVSKGQTGEKECPTPPNTPFLVDPENASHEPYFSLAFAHLVCQRLEEVYAKMRGCVIDSGDRYISFAAGRAIPATKEYYYQDQDGGHAICGSPMALGFNRNVEVPAVDEKELPGPTNTPALFMSVDFELQSGYNPRFARRLFNQVEERCEMYRLEIDSDGDYIPHGCGRPSCLLHSNAQDASSMTESNASIEEQSGFLETSVISSGSSTYLSLRSDSQLEDEDGLTNANGESCDSYQLLLARSSSNDSCDSSEYMTAYGSEDEETYAGYLDARNI